MLSMFLNPWMLLAALGFAIPIIIEIIFRRRRRQMDLPTIRYLLANPEKKKIKRQDQILLFLRCMVPFVLAWAVARPSITPSGGGAAKKRHVIMLIDCTISMGQQVGVSNAFALARNKAESLLRALPKGTLVSVLALRHQAQLDFAREENLYTAGERIKSMKISHGAASIAEALPLIETCISEGKDEIEDLYVFSDFQKSTWLKKTADGGDPVRKLRDIQATGELTLVDVGGSRQFNYFVTELVPEDPLLAAGRPASFRCTIEATGVSSAPNQVARVTFIVNGEKQGMQEFELKSGRKTIAFPYRFEAAGEYRVEVYVEGDNNLLDNKRYYLASVPDSYRVLLVDETANAEEGKFLHAAIEPPARPGLDRFSIFSANAVAPSEIVREDLSKYCAVVLLSLERVPQDLLNKLEPYVRDGGNAFFFLGPRLNAWEYNEKLFKNGKGLLPGKIEKPERSAPLTFKQASDPHPALRFMDGNGAAVSGDIVQFTSLGAGDGTAKTMASFSNDKPAMIERTYGQGRVITFTASAGPPDNFMPLSPGFPVLMQELLAYLAGDPDRGVNLLTGETLHQDMAAGAQASIVRKPDNSKVRVAPEKTEGSDLLHINFNQTDQMGVYEIDAQGGVVKRPRFVVNLRSEESDLDRLEEKDLSSLLSGGATWIAPGASIEEAVQRKYSVYELAGTFLWALAGLLALESLLAAKFGMRRG